MYTLESNRAFIKAPYHLRGSGTALFADTWHEHLGVYLCALSLSKSHHIMHYHVEFQHRRRSLSGRGLQGELDGSNSLLRVGRNNVNRIILNPCLENGCYWDMSVPNKRILR